MANTPPEGFPAPDQKNMDEEAARRKVREDIIGWIRHGHIQDAFKAAQDSALPEPDIQAAAVEGMYQQLVFGYLDDAIDIIKTFQLPPEVMAEPRIQDAALSGMAQRLRMTDTKNALEFVSAFNLPEAAVHRAAVGVMMKQLVDVYALDALEIAKDFKLPPAILHGTELCKAAMAGIKRKLGFGEFDTALAIVQAFNPPESEVRLAAMHEMVERLSSEYNSSGAHRIAEKFNLPEPEVRAAALVGVVNQIYSGRIEKVVEIVRNFKLTKEEVRAAAPHAKTELALQGRDIVAQRLEKEFGPY